MAAAAWESNDVSSIIRIIFLKEESAWTAELSLKDELILGSTLKKPITGRRNTRAQHPGIADLGPVKDLHRGLAR
jgi:hypothetical protein